VSTRLKIASVVVAVFVVAALTAGILSILTSGDEDRPPIIVRNGSVKIDGGNASKWKPWKENGSKKKWQPDHNNGASVTSFAVTIANSNGPAAPSNPCPSLPITGTHVVIEYKTDGGAKSQIAVGLEKSGSKLVPQIDAPADLTSAPGSGSTPAVLTYDPGGGMISNVTVSDDSGGQQMCGFVSPASALITIKPNR
jgi:hypothetical protein